MIWGYDVHDVKIERFSNRLVTPNKQLAQFMFKDASAIEISSSRPAITPAPFLYLEGADTRDITLMNNNFKNLKTIVQSDKQFNKKELTQFNNLTK